MGEILQSELSYHIDILHIGAGSVVQHMNTTSSVLEPPGHIARRYRMKLQDVESIVLKYRVAVQLTEEELLYIVNYIITGGIFTKAMEIYGGLNFANATATQLPTVYFTTFNLPSSQPSSSPTESPTAASKIIIKSAVTFCLASMNNNWFYPFLLHYGTATTGLIPNACTCKTGARTALW